MLLDDNIDAKIPELGQGSDSRSACVTLRGFKSLFAHMVAPYLVKGRRLKIACDASVGSNPTATNA